MRGNRFYHSGWDKLTKLSGQALTFNADGNLTSDGLRNYTWDAENRLVGIAYPGQSGKATAFSYDGLSRRTAIASTPTGGGGAVTTSYIWCGAAHLPGAQHEQCGDARIFCRGRVCSRLPRRRTITARTRSARCAASSPVRVAHRLTALVQSVAPKPRPIVGLAI